jgi:hypothetical protein
MPDFVNLDRLGYPEHLNATVELVDRHVAEGRGGTRPPGTRPSRSTSTFAIRSIRRASSA